MIYTVYDIHRMFAEHSYIKVLNMSVWAWQANVIMYVLHYQVWYVLYLFNDYLQNVQTWKGTTYSAFGLSPFILRNLCVHNTSKNQCTCFCGLPESILHMLLHMCSMIPNFLGVVFRSCKKSDVPRSLQSWVSTIQSVVLTADVFQRFIKGTYDRK